MTTHKIAIVQEPPVLLKRAETIEKVVAHIDKAAAEGAELIIFPETYLPGYPVWIWEMIPGGADDYELGHDIHATLLDQAVTMSGGELDPVRAAVEKAGVYVVLGIHERDDQFSRTTLYNTLVVIGSDGEILNKHRKLVPTNPERMVWAPGDGAGLNVVETPFGRLGGLICWENYMPLARFSLYAQGVQIYVAPTWDDGDVWISSMRHIAKEGRCWVIGAGCSMQAKDIPDDFPDRDRLFPDPEAWINNGDSVVVSPTGKIVAGPLRAEHGVLTAEIDTKAVDSARFTLDTAGHYGRPDIFSLTVDKAPRRPVTFVDTTEG